MSAKRLDFLSSGCEGIPCEQGVTFAWQATWQVEQVIGSGVFVPVDLTNYTAKMQLRKNFGSPIVLELNTSNGRIVLGGALGTITLEIAAADSAVVPPGVYKYDLDLTSAGGTTKFLTGLFEIVGSITL